MIGYVTLGCNDLPATRAYYGALLGSIGMTELLRMEDRGFTLFGKSWGSPALALCEPFDGKDATVGNGNMIALVMDSRATVDALYAKALELGGTDEGPPGVRGEEGNDAFYGAYFRDPEGHKICAYRVGPAV